MNGFGISFTGDFSGMPSAPKGHCPSWISLGDFSEGAFSDLRIWNVEDYLTHWRLAARELTTVGQAAFCDTFGFGKQLTCIWWGEKDGDTAVFRNILFKSEELNIDGLAITPVTPISDWVLEEGRISLWRVPMRLIAAHAEMARAGRFN